MDQRLFAKALIDPADIFQTPAAVLSDETLTTQQKIEILRRWEHDAREISVAEDEGMPARNSDTLEEVLQALAQLVGECKPDRTSQGNQGGL